jgi:hypothetical protein
MGILTGFVTKQVGEVKKTEVGQALSQVTALKKQYLKTHSSQEWSSLLAVNREAEFGSAMPTSHLQLLSEIAAPPEEATVMTTQGNFKESQMPGFQNPLNRAYRTTAMSLAESFSRMDQGVKQIERAESFEEGISGVADVTMGGVGAFFSPISGAFSTLPPAEKALEGVFWAVGQPIKGFVNLGKMTNENIYNYEVSKLKQDIADPELYNKAVEKLSEDKALSDHIFDQTEEMATMIAGFGVLHGMGKKVKMRGDLMRSRFPKSIEGKYWELDKINFEKWEPTTPIEVAFKDVPLGVGGPKATPALTRAFSQFQGKLKHGYDIALKTKDLTGKSLLKGKRDFVRWYKDFYSKEVPSYLRTPEVEKVLKMTESKGRSIDYIHERAMNTMNVFDGKFAFLDMRKGRPGIDTMAALPETGLVTEAKKYKSAEEFVDSLTKDRTQSVSDLIKRGYTKEQAELIADKANNMMDVKSPSIKDIVDNPNKYTPVGGGEITIYRVVPKDGKIEYGDFIFTEKKAAETFRDKLGFIRGQNEIVEIKTGGENLLKPKASGFENELIYLPKEIQTKSQLTDIWNQANKKLPTTTLPDKFAHLEGPEGKFERTFKKKAEEVVEKTVEIETVNEKLRGFEREDLNSVRKLSRSLEKTDGDIETLRKNSPEFVNTTVEMVSEKLGVGEAKALEFIKDVPTRGQIQALKKERRLTIEEANKLKKRIARLQPVRKIADKQAIAQSIKSEIIEYAKDIPLRERGKLLATIKNAKTVLDLTKAVDRVKDLQEFSEKKEIVRTIESELKKSSSKKVSGISRGKYTAKTQRLIDTIKEVIKQDRNKALDKIDQNIAEYSGEAVPNDVRLKNAILEMSGIKDMNLTELKITLKRIEYIKEKGELKVSLKKANEDAKIERVVDAAVDEFSGMKGVKYGEKVGVKTEKELNIVTETADLMYNAVAGYRNILEKLSKHTKDSATKNWTVKTIHEARKLNTKLAREWRVDRLDKYTEIMNAKTNRELKNKLAEQGEEKIVFEGKDRLGKNVKLEYSELEAADLYMKMQDPTLDKVFTETMRYTEEMKLAVSGSVSLKLRKFADWLIDEHYPTIKKDMKVVFENKYGVSMPENPAYSPLRRFGLDIKNDTDLLVGDVFPGRATTTPSSAKSRVGSMLPIEANNILKVAARHELQVAQFVSFDKAVGDLRKVFGNEDVKAVIKQYHGGSSLKRLNDIVDNIARGSIDARLTLQAVDKLQANFAKSVLLLNYVPFFKQLTSYPAFAASMPLKDFATGTVEFAKDPVKWSKFLLSNSETLYDRVTRGFDKETALALKSGREKVRIGGNDMTLKGFILNSLVMPTRGGDMLPVLPGATAKYLEQKKLGKSDEVAIREAELAVLSSQQSPHIEDLAHFQTAGSLLKTMALFQTTPIQYFRESIDSVRSAKYGRISKKEAAKKLSIYWVLLPVLFQFVSDGFRVDEDHMKRSLIFGPLNYYPAIGNLLQTIYGVTMGEWWRDSASAVTPMFSLVDDFVQSVSKVTKGITEREGDDIMEGLVDFALFLGQVKGVPTAGPRRTFSGITDLITGETDDIRRLFFSEYALDSDDDVKY